MPTTMNYEPRTIPMPTESDDRPLIARAVRAYGCAERLIDNLQSVFALAIRIYVAQVFFRSGMIKLSNWDSTLALFANEYHVPVLSPTVAAYLGTAAEMGL